MRRQALTGLAALTLFDIATAHAQAPVFSWAGFYAGINGGYEWGSVSGTFPFGGFPTFPGPTFPVITSPYSLHPNTGIFGFQGGYNFWITPNWLAGLEGDFDFGHGSASTTFILSDPSFPATGSAQFTTTIDWTASIRGRFGYVGGPWLLYVTGGVSWMRMSVSGSGGFTGSKPVPIDGFATTSSSFAFSDTQVLTGFVIGPGFEVVLPPSWTSFMPGHWTLRVEYLFADYGHATFGPFNIVSNYTNTGTVPPANVHSVTSGVVTSFVTTQTLQFGLTFKFP